MTNQLNNSNEWISTFNTKPLEMSDELIMKTQMDNQAKETEDLYNKLKEEGHTCLLLQECFPPRLCWCHSTPCLGK